jgi:hypothetical protein
MRSERGGFRARSHRPPQPPSDIPSQVVELKNGPTGPVIVWQMIVKPGGITLRIASRAFTPG